MSALCDAAPVSLQAPHLGKKGDTSAPSDLKAELDPREANRRAWDAWRWLRGSTVGLDGSETENSSLHAVALCRSAPAFTCETVDLVMSEKGNAAFEGLSKCKSRWACPLCHRQVWAETRERVHQLMHDASEAGLVVTMRTSTLRHSRDHELSDLWSGLKSARAAVARSRPLLRKHLGYGHVGYITRTELTWGELNGWHLHEHRLDFWKHAPSAEGLWRLADDYVKAWNDGLASVGLPAVSREHGVRLERVDVQKKAADYLAKMAPAGATWEMTDADKKDARLGNVSPFTLLHAAIAGDAAAAILWREYEQGTVGRKAIQISNRLNARFPAGQPPIETREEKHPVCGFNAYGWNAVLRCVSPPELTMVAELGWSEATPGASLDEDAQLQVRQTAAATEVVALLESLCFDVASMFHDGRFETEWWRPPPSSEQLLSQGDTSVRRPGAFASHRRLPKSPGRYGGGVAAVTVVS